MSGVVVVRCYGCGCGGHAWYCGGGGGCDGHRPCVVPDLVVVVVAVGHTWCRRGSRSVRKVYLQIVVSRIIKNLKKFISSPIASCCC